MVSSCSLNPCTARLRRAGIASTSSSTLLQSLRIWRVKRSSCRYSRWRFRSPSIPRWRTAWAMAITRLRTLRVRSRTLRFSPPALPAIFFMVRVNTRAPVTQQTAVGRIVNIGFHYGRVHPHPFSLNHSPIPGQSYDSILQFRDGLRANHLSQSHQSLGVRHLLHPDPTEAAIHHVGAHLPL